MIGQLEAPDEASFRNPAVNKASFIIPVFLLPDNEQLAFLDLDIQIAFREPRDGKLDGVDIFVVYGLFDIIGRISLSPVETLGRVNHGRQSVEADNGAIKRRKIEITHGLCPCSSNRACPPGRAAN